MKARQYTEEQIIAVLEKLADIRGLPEVITVDNGPEFAGRALDEWAYRKGVKLNFIRPFLVLISLFRANSILFLEVRNISFFNI